MKIYPVNRLPDVIILGRQTEYGVNEIRIDCAPWLAIWPGMQISVWVTPPNGDGAYPASIRVEGDLVVWEIGAADTNAAGSGYVEIMGLAEGKKKLSATAATKVLGTTTGTTTEPPEAHRAWVEEVARNAMRAEDAAKKAEESAAEIADAKESGAFDGADGVGIKSVSVTRSPDQYGYYYIIINLTDGQQQAIPYKNGSDANVTAENIANALGFTPVSIETVNNIAEGKIDSPATGMVGQFLVVKTVDDNGKPSEWETVTFTVPRPDEKPTEVVLYTAQELTEEQKAQARTNIAAVAAADLANYYLKSETYSREEINQRISAIPKFGISVVSSLPTSNISETTIYLVGGGETGNLYTEYIRVNGAWEVLGSQRVDLTGYATETWVVGQLAGYQPKGNYALKSELPDVPVKSVNNKTGDVKLNASDVGADPSGTAENAVSTHNQSETAHQDIRRAVSQLSAEMAGKVTSPSVAEVGQVIAVKAVDETGRPTEWEAVDMAAGGGSAVQPDWNQTDASQPDYIKNKPFGEGEVVILEEQELTYDEETGGYIVRANYSIEVGDVITVVSDGSSYTCEAQYFDEMQAAIFGNMSMLGGDIPDTGEPFLGLYRDGAIMLVFTDTEKHTVKISGLGIVQLPSEYVERQAVFYVTYNDEYIYTDADLSNKATRRELVIAEKTKGVRLVYMVMGVKYFDLNVLSIPIIEANHYSVVAYEPLDSKTTIKEYYTAEYVPETTE